MTDYAHCTQCPFHFVTHTDHPVPPAHNIPGTNIPCSGSGKTAEQGVAR